MKSIVEFAAIFMAVFIMVSGSAMAGTIYVKGVMQITMRTAPGVENKVVAMVDSGDTLEILERNDEWSRVRKTKGKAGWVLTRYLTSEMPVVLLFEGLKKKNAELSETLERLQAENVELSATEAKLQELEKSYVLLKNEAADFLDLKKRYDEVTMKFKDQQERIALLEKSLGKEDLKWFMGGAGVLLLGMLLGMVARKKKRNSLL